jgi:LCP family protein required for cell wall assembly
LTTSASIPTTSSRRFAVAGVLELLVPGLGHALIGRWQAALILFVPVLLLVMALLGLYAGGGATALLAFAVTPGVLPALAILNLVLAGWRIAGSADILRHARRPAVIGALVGPAALVLVIAPHLWAGSTIVATSDFLDSMFASGEEPAEIEEPFVTPPPDWTPPPFEYETPEPVGSPTASASPGPSPTKKPPSGPMTAGTGSLPGLNVSVPWDRPGAVPWGNDGRFDLLLLGSDAGRDRWSRRMDVMLLVEIDVATGKVAMIGIPRNIQNAPLPAGPARDAVACGCYAPLLNGLYVEATVVHPGRWPGEGAVAGIGAVRSVVSELTGRPIDAVLVADLWGVIKVVDAMGGIDIDVPSSVYDAHYPDPVMGNIEIYIPAGQQHLNGRMALAYARSRHQDSDYSRMSRQQTMLLAIRDGIGAETILNAPALFKAAKGFAWTDLPRDSLPNLVNLFGSAANASVKHLRVVPPKYPSWLTPALVTKIRKDIAALLGVPPPTPAPSPTPGVTPSPSAAPTPPPTATPSDSPPPPSAAPT